MRRRNFGVLLAGAVIPVVARIAARAVRAEGTGPVVIGVLSPFTRADSEEWHQAFRQGLHNLGWVEGATVRIEYRFADGRSERLPGLVAELVNLKVAIIVAAVATDALAAAQATKTIPIVMASAGDPVAAGLVRSLARPGGNITGLTQISTDLAAKRLELLKEVAPEAARVAVLWNPEDASSVLSWREIQDPARQLGFELHSLQVRENAQLDAAFASATGAHDSAITVLPAPIFVDNRKRIADFAAANRLPSVFHLPEFVHVGGLLSYGPDRADLFRRAATYVDKILKGVNPGDLAVEQPTKFQLVINLKAAKALGLRFPQSLLASADEVIE
jgi:putative tryptophan/tyrosine transport system substrate-binding protein